MSFDYNSTWFMSVASIFIFNFKLLFSSAVVNIKTLLASFPLVCSTLELIIYITYFVFIGNRISNTKRLERSGGI